MDMQDYFNQVVAAGRKSTFDRSDQLTLGELKLKLELIVSKQNERIKDGFEESIVLFDFVGICPGSFDSWRGSYNEIALGFSTRGENKTVTEFLQEINEAIGKTYTGWKGGDFTMTKNTPVWVANPGESGNTGITEVVDDGYHTILITGICEF